MRASVWVWVAAAAAGFLVQLYELRNVLGDLRRVRREGRSRSLPRHLVAVANLRSLVVRILASVTFLVAAVEILTPPLGLQGRGAIMTVAVVGAGTALLQAIWSVLDQRDRARLIRYHLEGEVLTSDEDVEAR